MMLCNKKVFLAGLFLCMNIFGKDLGGGGIVKMLPLIYIKLMQSEKKICSGMKKKVKKESGGEVFELMKIKTMIKQILQTLDLLSENFEDYICSQLSPIR